MPDWYEAKFFLAEFLENGVLFHAEGQFNAAYIQRFGILWFTRLANLGLRIRQSENQQSTTENAPRSHVCSFLL